MPERRKITDSAKEEMAVLAVEDSDNPFDKITADPTEQPLIIFDEPEEPQKPLSKDKPATDVPVYRDRPDGRWRSAEDFLQQLSVKEDQLLDQPIEAEINQDRRPTLDEILNDIPDWLKRRLPGDFETIDKMTLAQLRKIRGIGPKKAILIHDRVHQELTRNSITSPS